MPDEQTIYEALGLTEEQAGDEISKLAVAAAIAMAKTGQRSPPIISLAIAKLMASFCRTSADITGQPSEAFFDLTSAAARDFLAEMDKMTVASPGPIDLSAMTPMGSA